MIRIMVGDIDDADALRTRLLEPSARSGIVLGNQSPECLENFR